MMMMMNEKKSENIIQHNYFQLTLKCDFIIAWRSLISRLNLMKSDY